MTIEVWDKEELVSYNHIKQPQQSLKLTTIYKNLLKFTKTDQIWLQMTKLI
jgi:hypothetical protein